MGHAEIELRVRCRGDEASEGRDGLDEEAESTSILRKQKRPKDGQEQAEEKVHGRESSSS